MAFYETILSHTFSVVGIGGPNAIDGIARLFRSKVSLSYNDKDLNLKSPESMADLLNIDLSKEPIYFKKDSKIGLIVEGEDQEIAFPAIVEALRTNQEKYNSIWYKCFDERVNSGHVYKKAIILINELGVHARSAARMGKIARSFDAEFLVTYASETVWARSILMLLKLALSKGKEIEISTIGYNARKGLEAMVNLVNSKFGEPY